MTLTRENAEKYVGKAEEYAAKCCDFHRNSGYASDCGYCTVIAEHIMKFACLITGITSEEEIKMYDDMLNNEIKQH